MLSAELTKFLSSWSEVMEVGIMAVNQNEIVQFISPLAARMLGVQVGETQGKYLGQELVEDFKLRRTPGVQHFRTDKGSFRLTIMPLKLKETFTGSIAVIEDETKLVGLMDQLHQHEETNHFLRRAFNAVFEDFVAIDKEGRIVLLGEKTAYKLGVDRESSLGTKVSEIDPNCIMQKVLESGKPLVGQIWKFHDHEIPSMIVPLYEGGEVEGVIWKSVFRDLDEARQFVQKYSNAHRDRKNTRSQGTLSKARNYKFTLDDIVGDSPAFLHCKEIAKKAARSNSTVLLLGESGTGKELFAHAIHVASSRRHQPFIRVNCAGIPESLLESELFGYEEGAFSGARKGGKPGKFELANGGTIFLDEIGDMNMSMQAKLLRVLQEREIEKVGGTELLEIDIRVIAATNQDLQEKVKKGAFREDLYYRLDIISIVIPPLREHLDDLPLLVEHLIAKINDRLGSWVTGVSQEVMYIFSHYSWPGNVRELENTLEGAICIKGKWCIEVDDLPLHFKQRAILPPEAGNLALPPGSYLEKTIEDIEKQAIQRALKAAGGNKKQAAAMLGIPRSSFYHKLRRYQIGQHPGV